MSKTLRRTNRKTPKWVKEKKGFCYKKGYGWGFYELTPKEISRNIKKYHSDSANVMSVPAWFRREVNKQFRTRMNRETKRVLRQGDYENYNYDVNKNTVEWEWW